MIGNVLAWLRKEPIWFRMINLVQLAIVGIFIYGILFTSAIHHLLATDPGFVLFSVFVAGAFAGFASRQKDLDRQKSVAESYRNDWVACCRELERLGIEDPAATIRHVRYD